MQYRREIDGLRALAVIPVILFHAGIQGFSGGFVGVDVFFVISGYLITTIIIAEQEEGNFSLVRFYERRARRILPALFVVMFACLPFAWLWLQPEDMKRFAQSLVAVPLFSSNILFFATTKYFESAAELKPLLHTWSLAVEEQYYVLFPLFLMLTWKLGKRWIIGLLAVIAIMSLMTAQTALIIQPGFKFFLLPARAWEILAGAFAAFYLFKRDSDINDKNINTINQLLSVTGFLLLIYAILIFDKDTPFPSLYTLVPVLGTALIILFATPKTLIGKLLGNQLLVGIGLISYSAYLWHQPLFAFAKHRSIEEPSKYLLSILIVVAIVLAYLTWKFIETPFRNKQRIKRDHIFAGGAVISVLFIGFGFVGSVNKGYPNTFSRVQPGFNEQIKEFAMPLINNGWCFYSIDTMKNLSVGNDGFKCSIGSKSSNIKGLLFGDSFAGQYDPFWNSVGVENDILINSVTTNWCYPSTNDEFTGPQSSRAYKQCLLNRKFLADNYSNYDFVIFGGSWGDVYTKNKMDGLFEEITTTASKVKFVVVMAAPTFFDEDVGAMYRRSIFFHESFDITRVTKTNDKSVAEANSKLREFIKDYPNVLFFDRDSLFNINGQPSDLSTENVPYSLDGKHINIYGSKAAFTSIKNSAVYAQFKAIIKDQNMQKTGVIEKQSKNNELSLLTSEIP